MVKEKKQKNIDGIVSERLQLIAEETLQLRETLSGLRTINNEKKTIKSLVNKPNGYVRIKMSEEFCGKDLDHDGVGYSFDIHAKKVGKAILDELNNVYRTKVLKAEHHLLEINKLAEKL